MPKITLTRRAIARIGVAVVAMIALFGVAFAVGTVSRDQGDRADTTFPQVGETVDGLGAQGRAPGVPEADQFAASDEAAIAQEDLPFGDRIIREGDLTVEVAEKTFDQAWTRAFDIARRFGGSVLTSSRGTGDIVPLRESEQAAFGLITVRVPSDRFEEALNAMRGLGDVRSDRTSAQDVTEEFVDLSSRLRNLRAQEDALLRLMRKAESVQDILLVQRELANTQAEIERVTGRLNFLEARTEFSRITLTLAEPGALITPVPEEEGPSFAKAWDTAVVGLTRMAIAAMIALMWAAPFAAIAALVLWGLRRRPHAPAPTP